MPPTFGLAKTSFDDYTVIDATNRSYFGRAGGQEMTAPNLLTFSRMLLAIPFFVLITRGSVQAYDAGLVLFLFIALTDVADGFIARRWRRVTRLGRVMDPLSDKVLICGALIFLIDPAFGVYPWLVVAIILRELAVTSMRALVESSGQSYAARFGGKLKMACESVTVIAIIYAKAHQADSAGWQSFTAACMFITAAVAVLSALYGLAPGWRLLRAANDDVERPAAASRKTTDEAVR